MYKMGGYVSKKIFPNHKTTVINYYIEDEEVAIVFFTIDKKKRITALHTINKMQNGDIMIVVYVIKIVLRLIKPKYINIPADLKFLHFGKYQLTNLYDRQLSFLCKVAKNLLIDPNMKIYLDEDTNILIMQSTSNKEEKILEIQNHLKQENFKPDLKYEHLNTKNTDEYYKSDKILSFKNTVSIVDQVIIHTDFPNTTDYCEYGIDINPENSLI